MHPTRGYGLRCLCALEKAAAGGVDTTTLLSNRINHPDRQMHALFADCLLEGRLYAD